MPSRNLPTIDLRRQTCRILVTGSADGLGQGTARILANDGHQVILHARNEERAAEARRRVSNSSGVVIGDLSEIDQIKDIARQVNEIGTFDAIIHNAGIYQRPAKETLTVNTLAPYILTCLIARPKRLVYLSSGEHLGGRWNESKFESNTSYGDSKLHVLMLAKILERKWPEVYANAVDPGWVPTKMGGHSAPDDLQKGYETQAWLATSNSPAAKVSGKYFYHEKQKRHNPEADNIESQESFLKLCEQVTGIKME